MYNRPMYMQEGGLAGSFGSSINPSFGNNGVLENIQEQVSKNGDFLKLMQNRNQGGVGGNTADLYEKGFDDPVDNRPPSGDLKPIPSNPLNIQNPFLPPIQGGGNVPMPNKPGVGTPPNDMGMPLDMFGKINVDELNKQHSGIEKGFFESDEYNKFHYDPRNMMGTMDVSFSPYFGQQGSGSVGASQDEAYEAYLKRIGKSDLIGKNIPGVPMDFGQPLNFNYINSIPQPTPGSSNFTSAPIQEFANGGLADMGRFGDNQMVHAQTGEMVVPQSILQENPQIGMGLNQALVNQGLDPQRQVVGSGAGSMNPMTGQQEFFDLGKILKTVAPIAIGAMLGPAAGAGLGGMFGAGSAAGSFLSNPFVGRAITGALTSKLGGAKTKDALMAGLLSGGIGALTGGMGSEGSIGSDATKQGALKAGQFSAKEIAANQLVPDAVSKTATDTATESIKGAFVPKTMSGELLQSLGVGEGNILSKLLNTQMGEGLSAGLIAQLLAGGDEEEDNRTAYERRPFGFGGPGGKMGGITYANMGGEMGFPRRNGGIDPSEGSGRKDDVPAMLMAGEFVLTKDAVKGLGGGNQRKGIQRAYNMMDNLEARA